VVGRLCEWSVEASSDGRGVPRRAANPAEALADFRSFAEKQGIALASGEAADRLIERDLVRATAYAKWGEIGMYHVEAKIDPAVTQAVRSFDKAEAVLRVAK
jgi:hypothetical protein